MDRSPHGIPVIASGKTVSRLDVVKPEELTEGWLQELLDTEPSVLPISMIDDRIGVLAASVREAAGGARVASRGARAASLVPEEDGTQAKERAGAAG